MNKKIILMHIGIIIVIGLLIFLKFPCPFKCFVGYPCPACGTLHALNALLNLDFKSYCEYNWMAIPLVTGVWMGIHKNCIFNKSRIVDFLLITIPTMLIFKYILDIYLTFLCV
ncbi:MAG: DUF2752 domain-containing protein [Clostridia bacterium]|nr:DUF2752 domain-containing protein [Clostridia bacterium]